MGTTTVIDALMVTVGLDPAGFKKGQAELLQAMKETREADKKAKATAKAEDTAIREKDLKDKAEARDALRKTREENDKQQRAMQARAKETAAAFGKIKNEILGVLGVSLGASGLVSFAARITQSDAAVGRLATNLGMLPQKLSAWEGVAEKFGSSKSDIDGTFNKLFGISENLKLHGYDESLLPLGRLFGDPRQIAEFANLGKSGDLEGMAKMLHAAVLAAKDQQSAMALMSEAGFSQDTTHFFREVGDQLARNLELQKQLNVATERDVQLSIQRLQAISRLEDAVTGLGRALLNTGLVNSVINGATNVVQSAAKGDAGGWLEELINGDPNKADLNGSRARAQANAKFPAWITKIFDVHSARSQGQGGPSKAASVASAGGDKRQYLAGIEKRLGLPAGVLWAMYGEESSYGKNLRSPKGAKGPFQFTDPTAKEYGIAGKQDDFYASGDAAGRKMRDLLRQYGGDLGMALRAYNGGGAGAMGMYAESNKYASDIMGSLSGRGSSKTDIHIDRIVINTQATDAKGIASSLSSAINSNYALASHGNGGLQ